MIIAQHGDPDAPLPTPTHEHHVTASASGVVSRMDARAIGEAAWRLGAGRQYQGQPVQATAGIRLHAKPGATVTEGERLFTLYTETPEHFTAATQLVEAAVEVADAYTAPDVIIDVIR